MFEYFNPNPLGKHIGDCVIRALSKALNKDWHEVYTELIICGYINCDLPSSNSVWGNYLLKQGYKRYIISEDCTIGDFANEHANGTYIVGTGSHAVAVCDGIVCDAWDSSSEQPLYFYCKE